MPRSLVAFWFIALFALPLAADQKAQGFIVTAEEAVVYKNAEADEEISGLKKGEIMAGFSGFKGALLNSVSMAAEKGDRVRVLILKVNEHGNPVQTPSWIRKADVTSFLFECACGPKEFPCSPTITNGLKRSEISQSWNPCITEARDAKLASLNGAATTPAPAASAQPTVEERLAKIKELLDKGLLTKEEYDRKRAEILKTL